ncbi:MAG: GTPase ObgE [Candidatus Krumholzibacteriia bacterium]
MNVFLDVATIKVAAGCGGNGCVSTRREKFVPRGGPDGGNGGRGGSVWLVADPSMGTLLDFRYRREYLAEKGKPGSGSRRTGADGKDLVIPVPCGTSVIVLPDEAVLGDLTEPGQRLRIAEGGRGGRGNWEFRTARNQTPMKATPGQPGQELEVRLELRLIADIGLVGAPNAGKSTLLSVVTAARPKVADYPFTTLTPNLGIVDLGDYASCTLADIPGLIEGASEGKGLGHEFLRHIERTGALLLMVDVQHADPAVELAMLRGELADHGHRLAELPFAVLVTKLDTVDEERRDAALAATRAWTEAHGGLATLGISAVRGDNLDQLRNLLRRLREQAAHRIPDQT